MNWRYPLIVIGLLTTQPRILRRYREILKISKLSAKAISDFQNDQLSKLLMHAYENVPYYSKILQEAGVFQNRKIHLEHFSSIPILTKDIIRKNWSDLQDTSESRRKKYTNTSGGSTGIPIKITQDSNYSSWNIANKLYYAHELGKKIGNPEIKLWGSERDILKGSIGTKEKLINFIYNRHFHNAFLMDDHSMMQFIDKNNKIKPIYIWSYVDSIYEIAEYILKNNLTLHSPKSIVVTAGVLDEHKRKTIEKAFSSRVFNQYGSREVGDMAAENTFSDGLAIFEWSHKLETINESLLVTPLHNYSMPLIRYAIGDTGSISKQISQHIPHTHRISKLTGRTTNHFVLKDGSIVHGEYFTHMFYFKDWVKKFKVVQEDYDKITCYIVKIGKPKPSDISQITQDIQKVMGNNCAVLMKYVNEIQASKSGKYLYTESKITSHAQL